MSWFKENQLKWYHKLAINVLKSGPVPNHIAIIMDGNRRFAAKAKVEKAIGHSRGFDKLTETLMWCSEMGVKEVTVYAFSIENFKRSQQEVDTLMSLAREKFEQLLQERDKLNARGVAIRVIGDLTLIPEDLRKAVAETVIATKYNTSSFLNVALAYTSRNEIVNSMQVIAKGVQSQLIHINDISSELINDCMYSSTSPPPEIIIRTSGEFRFSDFLLWQISNTNVVFTDVLWPEYNIWHFLMAVFYFQRYYKDMIYTDKVLRIKETSASNFEVMKFIDKVNKERCDELQIYASLS